MPLDGHSYLVAQGWGGRGSGLRQGAISKPLAITQKRTLAGLGKDRDEAFPFWDHLFNAVAKSIQLKINEDDSSNASDTAEDISVTVHKRTSTGLISNRRPLIGTPASVSGGSTPVGASASEGPRLSLLAIAKREAAKKGLYSRFFRGPVLGPDTAESSSNANDSGLIVGADNEESDSKDVGTGPRGVEKTEARINEKKSKKRKRDTDEWTMHEKKEKKGKSERDGKKRDKKMKKLKGKEIGGDHSSAEPSDPIQAEKRERQHNTQEKQEFDGELVDALNYSQNRDRNTEATDFSQFTQTMEPTADEDKPKTLKKEKKRRERDRDQDETSSLRIDDRKKKRDRHERGSEDNDAEKAHKKEERRRRRREEKQTTLRQPNSLPA